MLNEKFGDGIMSAIDFYATVERVVGGMGAGNSNLFGGCFFSVGAISGTDFLHDQ